MARKFQKQKEPSYWDVMDGLEKFMIVFMVAMFGFFVYVVII